jgi:ligand-binding SRPBCC domain-containing protein
MAHRLERTLFIPRPRDEVFPFFANARNLERITPPFLRFEVATAGEIAMRAGALIDYRLRLHSIPFRWRTEIEEYAPPNYFVDAQLRGPYKVWRHRHDFTDAPGGTVMRDQVDYEVGFGPLGALARVLFVRRSVEQIFDYRNRVILEILAPEYSPKK